MSDVGEGCQRGAPPIRGDAPDPVDVVLTGVRLRAQVQEAVVVVALAVHPLVSGDDAVE